MVTNSGSYCIIKKKNLHKRFEDFINLQRADKLKGNSLLCYKYIDSDGKIKFAILGDALEKNGDYCLLENIASCSSDNLDLLVEEWDIVEISNQSFDVLFASEIDKMRFMYCLSDEERAISRMTQMNFPKENIESYKKDKTVYVYEGFTSIPLSQINNNGLKQIAARHKNLYAIIVDSLDEKRFIFLYSQKDDYFDFIKTKSGYLFGISAFSWIGGGHEPTFAGIQSCNGGIWVTSNILRCDMQQLFKKQK